MTSESGRISRLLADSRACMANMALAKARALYGDGGGDRGCKGGCEPKAGGSDKEVPQSSSLLKQKTAACTGYVSPFICVPESIRTATASRNAIDCYAANGPYPRVFPAPCPPVVFDPYYYDEKGERAGTHSLGTNISGLPPVLQGKVCPLPNKPYNPVLPG